MAKSNKPKRPSLTQAAWLRRIAVSPMMKTYVEGEKHPRYALLNGEIVPPLTAKALIDNRWVRGQRDGLMDDPQTYVALVPVRPPKPAMVTFLEDN